MFYVKQKISDTAEIHIEITDENVFTRCPKCNREIPIDLADIVDGMGNLDLFGTSVYCEECSRKERG